MAPERNQSRSVRFGLFEANLETGELWKQGRRVKLQEQPFEVLAILLQQSGTLVSREDLQRAIWPNDAYGDFDQGVNTAVRKIRQALGDSADNPRFIETLPRKGYRFIAPVIPPDEGSAAALVTPPVANRFPRLLMGLGAATLLSWSIFTVLSDTRDAPVAPFPVPLTTYGGLEREPSFSPEGNRVAFSWTRDNESNSDIYLKGVGSDQSIRLTQDPRPDFAPAWSPDGRLIAFGRMLDEKSVGIFVVPANGGPEAKLLEQPRLRTEQTYFPFVSWSPDGKWLALSDLAPDASRDDPRFCLFLLSIETGERRQLTTLPPKFRADIAPAFSSDGRLLALVRQVPPMGRAVHVLALTHDLKPVGKPRQIGGSDNKVISLAWVPGRNELLVSMSREYGITTEFWFIETAGGRHRRAPFATQYSDSVAVSFSGQVAYSQANADRNIWKAELDANENSIGRPRPFVTSTRDDQSPSYSPDGQQLAFTSNRSGTLEVWTSQADGANPRVLTAMGKGTTGAPQWSPDGSRIVFDSNRDGDFELYSTLAAGGPLQRLTNRVGGDGLGSFSRDGRSIYFISGRSGGPEIWKMPATGGTPVQITKRGGRYAIESPDGRYVYYSKESSPDAMAGHGGIWRVPVSGGNEVRVVQNVTFLNFALGRDGIYYIPEADSSGVYSVHYLPYATEVSRRILEISGQPGPGLTLSPDGRALLWTQTDRAASDLMLIPRVH